MSIIQAIKSAQLQARKDRKTEVVGTLTTLIGEIEYKSKAKGLSEAPDSDAVKTIRTFADNIGIVYKGYACQDNTDAATKARALKIEKELVESFLPPVPPQMSEDELRGVIQAFAAGVKATGAMPVMKDAMSFLKENYKDRYDGKAANQIVKEILT
jgi:uncharacterized protein YqeY